MMVMALYSHYRNAWKSHGVSSHISKIKDSMLHHIYYGLLLTWLSTYFDSTGVLVPEWLSSSLYWPIALRKKALYFILQVRTHFWKACWRTKLKHVTDSLLRGWVNSESIFRAGCCVNKLACEKFLIVAWHVVQPNFWTYQYGHICVKWTHVLLYISVDQYL